MILHTHPTTKKIMMSCSHPNQKLMQNNPIALVFRVSCISAQQHTVIPAIMVPVRHRFGHRLLHYCADIQCSIKKRYKSFYNTKFEKNSVLQKTQENDLIVQKLKNYYFKARLQYQVKARIFYKKSPIQLSVSQNRFLV